MLNLPEGFITAGEAATQLLNEEHLNKYFPTGFSDIDRIIGGMRKGDLILLASRPGMGKTQFSLNIAYNFAKATGKMAVFTSYNCSIEQLGSKVLWMLTGLRPSAILRHDNTYADVLIQHLTDVANSLDDIPLIIYDAECQNVGHLKYTFNSIEDIGMIVIDYLQLLESHQKFDNRTEEIKDILAQLKKAAKDLNVPIIVNCQIGRERENRADKKPMPADLGFDDDVFIYIDDILFLYKESYYHEDHRLSGI